MKRCLLLVGALLAAAGVVGVLVLVTGLVPITASSGHWGVTRALLVFSKQRSVATHAPEELAIDLEDPALVLKGAGHYHTACLPCHGSPEAAYFPRIAKALTAPPPYLPETVPEWEPEELFYIVKHGIKFTGMPAWPSQHRDDEVRAMVAFLVKLPGLDKEGYRRLAHGDAGPLGEVTAPPDAEGTEPVPRALVASCARCHGADGGGRGTGAFPKLAGQHRGYLLGALDAFAAGARHSGIMEPVATGLDPETRRRLADYYGGMPSVERRDDRPPDPAAIARGEGIALRGVPARGIPACVQCHGPGGAARNPAYPALAGQYPDYVALQLELFKEQRRGGSPWAHLMSYVAARLSPEEIRDVAQYYGSLSATPPR
jgi:cytochrome c553